MKNCIYPLVIYADIKENNYFGLFPDLDLSASGDTIEDTYKSAIENLEMYLQMATKLDSELSSPSTYVETVGLNPKRVVLLAMVKVDENAIVLTDEDKEYRQILANMLVNAED